MTTQEIANRLVELCRTGQYEQCYQELYSPNIVSIEPSGAMTEKAQGFEELKKKGEAWQDMVQEVHSGEVSDPITADGFFSCIMTTDLTYKDGNRVKFSEVCVYEVQDGKIVKEQFFYRQ